MSQKIAIPSTLFVVPYEHMIMWEKIIGPNRKHQMSTDAKLPCLWASCLVYTSMTKHLLSNKSHTHVHHLDNPKPYVNITSLCMHQQSCQMKKTYHMSMRLDDGQSRNGPNISHILKRTIYDCNSNPHNFLPLRNTSIPGYYQDRRGGVPMSNLDGSWQM